MKIKMMGLLTLLALAACNQNQSEQKNAVASQTKTIQATENNENIQTASAISLPEKTNLQQRLANAETLRKLLLTQSQDSQKRPKLSPTEQKDDEKVRLAALDDMKFFREQTAALQALNVSDNTVKSVRDKLVKSRELSADILEQILQKSNKQERMGMMIETSPQMEQSVKLQEQALQELAAILQK